MTNLIAILTYAAPLTIASITLTLWLILVVLQLPRLYWRDALNFSIAGMLCSLSVLLMLWATAIDRHGPVILAGLFALVGLPRTVRERLFAIERRRSRSAS